MVDKRQVLERATLIHSDGVELEALFQSGGVGVRADAPVGVVFAGPHVRLGGNMDCAVLSELVWTLARLGHPTLRFNWRGVGGSQGVSHVPWLFDGDVQNVDWAGELSDLRAAIAQHAPSGRCALVGYSVGCAVAALACLEPGANVQQLVLVAPPVLRVAVAIAEVSALLPTAVVVGANDAHAPLARLTPACVRAQLHVVPDANHSFTRGLTQMAQFASAALQTSELAGD